MNLHTAQSATALVLLLLMSLGHAQTDTPMMAKETSGQSLSDPIPHNLCEPDGVAIGGYDVVSYRQEGGPQHGSKAYSATHNGRHYWFADADNRAKFLEDPKRYIPAYNGFCAITLALGRVTCPQYDNFKIEDDRLLLFEITGFTNGRTLWNSNPENFREKADNNFLQLAE